MTTAGKPPLSIGALPTGLHDRGRPHGTAPTTHSDQKGA